MNVDDLFSEYKADRELNKQGSLMGSERQATLLGDRSPLRATLEDLFGDPLSMMGGPSGAAQAAVKFMPYSAAKAEAAATGRLLKPGQYARDMRGVKRWLSGAAKTPEGEQVLRSVNQMPETLGVKVEGPAQLWPSDPVRAPVAGFMSPRNPAEASAVPHIATGGLMRINRNALRGVRSPEDIPKWAATHELTHPAIDKAVAALAPEQAIMEGAVYASQVPGAPGVAAMNATGNMLDALTQYKNAGGTAAGLANPRNAAQVRVGMHEAIAYANEAKARGLPLPKSLKKLLEEYGLAPKAKQVHVSDQKINRRSQTR